MKNYLILVIIILIGINTSIYTQSNFRSGVFLHHSTGANIWGPNGSSTSIPQQITIYNATKGYTGDNAVSMNEVYFPGSGIENEWYDWHNIFDGGDPNNNIYPYIADNKIVVIKSCFPSSNITGYGSPADTSGIGVNYKTIYNYKWHWKSILNIMKQYPENFFVIWTNAPLVAEATNFTEARLANEFCTWAKDTLANGKDPVYGAFPPNVYVFDFFHKLAMPNGYMNPAYQVQSGDSHPNAAATELVAPQFVQEAFNAALNYEGVLPVELTSFTATTIGSTVKLSWITATEVNNYGFEVERWALSAERQAWIKIGFVNGNGNSNSPKGYSFVDNNLPAGRQGVSSGKYSYRLKQIDNDGQFEYSNTIEAYIGAPDKFELGQNYPNPFNPSTSIKYQVSSSSLVTLKVYDVLGNEVATLVDEYKPAGSYEAEFKSTVGSHQLASGVYFYRLQAVYSESGSAKIFVETRKMIMLQ